MSMRRRNRRPRKTRDARLTGGCTAGESLERRQLFSVAPLMSADEKSAVAAIIGRASTAGEEATAARSLVVVDAGAVQAGTGGVAGISASFADAAATLVIDSDDDLFADVQAELNRLGGISTIHLVSHGAPGSFTIGSTRFAADTVGGFAASLEGWHRLAAPGADLAVWGCGVAGGDGASLIDSIQGFSGFDVAASTDLTGPAWLGGDFDLEYAAGDVARPRLVAGVDVLWDTTLAPPADHTFTTTVSKDAIKSAFTALTDTVAPAIKTALDGQTSSTATDNLVQRTISQLFTDPTSISPADLLSLLDLETAASTYLAGASPTLSGLAAAIEASLATKATAAGAAVGSRTITVTPSVAGNLVSLEVAITATGTKQADVDLGTDALPSLWGSVVRTLNSVYGAAFRTTPKLETGTTLTTGFKISLDLTNASAPTTELKITNTNLAGGIYSFGPGIRFGILDATLGGQASLPYSTTVSFGTAGDTRAVDDWATPDASASSPGTPSATVDLPITASINGTPVTQPTSKLRVASLDPSGLTPPTVTGIDLGLLAWFGNLTSDELINAVKRVGSAYETLGANEALDSAIPFVQRTSLVDVFKLGDLFDEKIGSVIDVSVPTVMPTEAGSGLTFTVTAGGTQLTLSGDKRGEVSVGQAVGLVPSTPSPLDPVIRTVTAVTLSGGNTLVTINGTIDGTTTAGSLVGTTPARPDDLQTLADFQSYEAFAALGITPVYDGENGTVSIQFATSRTTPAAGTPAVAFETPRLGAVTFSSGGVAGTTATKIAFGVQFDIGPGSPIVISLGADPVAGFRLSGDAKFTITPVGGSTTSVTLTKASTDTNASVADLVDDLNDVLGSTLLRARQNEFGGGIELYTPTVNKSMPIGITVDATRSQAAIDLGFADGIELNDDTKDTPITLFGRPTGVTSRVVPHSDTTKKFAESTLDWQLDGLAGTVGFGINTVAFATTDGDVDAAYSAVLASAGGSVDDIDAGTPGLVTEAFGGSAALKLQSLSRVGAANDIASTAEITIAVPDLTKERIDAFVNVGAVLAVPGLEDSGRGTGRLSADAKVRFTAGSDTYEVTVTKATAANNTTFAHLVSNFNQALMFAQRVVNGTTDTSQSFSLAGQFSFTGSGGRVSAMHLKSGVWYPVLENLLVPNLAAGGGTTGRLTTASSLSVIRGADTYTVTVPAADTTANTTFADLVADFNAAFATARRRLPALTVPNVVTGGATNGQLSADASVEISRGVDIFIVTVLAANTTGNATFADLVADFNDALQTAQKQTDSDPVTVDARSLFVFSAGQTSGQIEPASIEDASGLLRFAETGTAGRVQPQSQQQVVNSAYATVTPPPAADMGEIGYQAGLSVKAIAGALSSASRVFDVLERDLKEFTDQSIPLVGQPLSDLIELNGGLDGRIQAFGKLSASSPQELERALETSLGVPSSDLRIAYDSVRKAYRIDFAYRASKLATASFDVDMGVYYELLGKPLPKGVDSLTDGDSKTPLNVVVNSTSVLSIGYDLVTETTFLYGHDGSTSHGIENGTSFTITFSVNGQKLQFPAKFGMDVRNGTAKLENGELVVELAGPSVEKQFTGSTTTLTVDSTTGLAVGMAVKGTGIPAGTVIAQITSGTQLTLSKAVTKATGFANFTSPSARYEIFPATGSSQLAALDIDNYAAAFGGKARAIMPIFDAFAPANLTVQSQAELLSNVDDPTLLQNHPASFYFSMPDLAGYFDAVNRLEEARTAISTLMSAGKTVDAAGIQLGNELDRLGFFGSAEYLRWRASWRGRLETAAEDLGGVLFAFAPELENSRNLLGAQETLVDYIRDPAMVLDKLNAAIGGVESALKGLNKIPLPFMEGKLGGAVSSVFSFRTGWLLDMRNKMRGAGEGIFDVMRQSVFEYLGPKNANILLKYDPLSMDRSLDSMVAATRPEDIGVVFMDKNREILQNDVRGADAFEIVFRLGQKVFDTGIDLGFQLDALQSVGIGAAFNGGLRLQVGWEMLLGFGFSIQDGFYLKVDSSGDASSRGNFSGSTGQFEAQLRFDATLTGASKNYTQQWDADAGYWKIVDTKGTAITTDDTDVIDAMTNEPYRAIAVNNQASDVTATVSTVAAEYDPCGCGEKPSTTRNGQKIWWVVGTDSGNGSFVPAELNDQGMYVPQTSAYPHTLIEVTAMKPAQLSGSLFFLRLAATDKIRRGLSGFTDVDSQYFYDAGDGPQVTAAQRDDEATGVNRNNELPTRFSAAVGLNMVDPSASAGRNTVREEADAPGGAGTKRVQDPSGKLVVGNSGAIAKEGRAWSLAPLFWQEKEIEGVYAKEYYEFKLKVAPPAKYDSLDFPVRLATGGNIALRGMGIIDGVQVKVGDRVLVKNQAIPSENGIYTVSPGGWERAFDANDDADFNGGSLSAGSGKPMFVMVEEGRTNKGTGWNLRDDTGNVTLGTTPLYFERTMVAIRELLPAGLGYLSRLVPYQPFIVLPIRADLIDEQQAGSKIKIQVEYDLKNYVVTLDTSSGGSGAALRTAQLNVALTQAVPAQLDAQGDVEAVPDSEPYNLAQAGFTFVTPGEADKKWYRIEFARLKEVDGLVARQAARSGTFVDYGTPLLRDMINTQKGWDPVADINADASPGRITWRELKSAGFKKTFQVDFHADAVANLTMELSVGDTASNPNISIPRIFADFNLDWSTRAARARIDKAKQDAKDLQVSSGVLTSSSTDEPDVSLVKRVQEEEGIEKPSTQTPGGDKGINPASPLVKEMDLKPEIGFNNIRLDVGSFLTKFIKPTIDEAEPYLRQIRPVLTFFNTRIPVLSDVSGRTIKVVDLLEAYGGPKGKTVRTVIEVVTAVDNLAARIAALPLGVNVQIPMGRFWFPKQFDDPAAINGKPPAPGSKYKYGDLVYDNLALGKRASGFYGGDPNATADIKAKEAIDALRATNPDSDAQKRKQGFISNNAADRGGIRVPLIDDPLNLFQLMMGKTATLVTYQLPKLNYEFEKEIPLLKIVCFEVGLRASFELNSSLAFGFDTYGINQYMVSGDIKDIAQGFYVSDRANADGTGADVPEFQAIASFGLYGGVNLVLAKGGIEGGLRFVGEVNLNDPNNDGKLRLTELIGIVADTGNVLDIFDLSFRGEVYARYYYKVGVGKLAIKGGKTFARVELFNLVREGNDGAPIFASRLDGTEGDAVPGTLLIHVGEAAVKRVSNQDPLNAKDGAERYKIWNSGSTVYVQYLNYSDSTTKEWEGVTQVVFEGGLGNDELDASGLNGIPLLFKGGDGNDRAELGSGHAGTVSRIEGDDGNDTIIVNGGGVVEILGGVGNDVITGGTGIVWIEPGEGNDTITTRAGSSSTIVMADDYGIDTAVLAAEALQNLLDFTTLGSALEILLDGALAANADGTATAGEKNKLTFNAGGVTEIRGSSQDDTFTAKNPRTRNAARVQFGVMLRSTGQRLPELDVPNLAADGLTTGRLARDSSISIDIGKYTYTVTVPKTSADNNFSIFDLVNDFNTARATARRQDRTAPDTDPTSVDATSLIDFIFPSVDFLTGLLLRGGQGDDLYDLTLDNVGGMGTDGIVIDDVQAVVPATAGEVKTCGTCNEIESIAVAASGKGYELPPEVMIIDPTGSGAKATAVIDDEGRVTAIQIIEGGSGYTSPTALLIAPRSLGDKLVISSTRSAATLTDLTGNLERTPYRYSLDGKMVRFLGWGDGPRPAGLDQSEIDSVTVNMPEGVLTLGYRINLFQTFTVNASRMVQNGRVNADTIDIETDHGFQVKHPLNAVNSGDVKVRVTGDGTNTGEGSDLNAVENRATASAVVSAGGVTSLALGTAGSKYFFIPSITVGADGATPGTGARFAATIAGSGGGLSGFTQLSPGTGYYSSPTPVVVIPPPASIQIDAMITSSRSNVAGIGDGRGRVLLFADTGMVSTSGEVFFPEDKRPGQPQGTPTIDWIGGDYRYRSTVGLDDIVSPVAYPGVSVGTGAAFTAVLDADGRVTGFTRVSGGSGYSTTLPPLIEIEGLATAVVDSYGSNGSIESLRVTYPGDGYGQPPRVTIKPNGFGRVVNSPNGVASGTTADGVTPMNRVHIRSIGGTLVAVAGAGVGDPLKPIKSDVEKFVAQVTVSGGVHLLEKDGLRIGKDQEISGITTVNGDVSITTFGGTLELGAPRQAVDEQGRLLWQDAAKTIPIYERDPETGRIIYEGGDLAVGSGDVKLTADDVEVNVDLNASGGTGTITLQPVGVKAEIGLAGTRARIEGTVTDGKLTGFDATKFWGGRGYTTAPLVIVDPAGQRAFASAVVEAGKVTAVDVLFGGSNYDPDDPPVVTLAGGGVSGSTPANQAMARAIVGADGVITGFELLGGTVENGRLKADATIRFTHESDTYEVTVSQSTAAGNVTFADLVADLQGSLLTARKVINGSPDLTRTYDILTQFQFQAGANGQIGLRYVGATPAVQVLQNYVVPNLASAGGSGYVSSPNVSVASPGQALVQAVLDTSRPDPVTGRFSVKEFLVTNQGRNYRSVPTIEVAAPYDFTLDADEVNKFAGKFAQVVIGRIEGQHLFHSPEGQFQGNVVLRAPRAGGTLDVASFTTTGPVSIVGSGSTFHFDAEGASVSGTSISIDDNVIVHKGVSGVATSGTGEIVVFGAGKGMIDGDPNGDDDGDNEDLRLAAKTNVTVTGAIGSRWKLDDLTITTANRGLVTLEQGVRLTGSLRINGSNANGDTNPGLDADDVVGAVMIGGIVDVDGDLVIDASSAVTFQADVTVGGKLEIRGAASVTFKRGLSVGGTMTLEDVPGAIRFGDVVHVVGEAEIKAGTLIEIGGGIRADGNLTLTSDAIDLKGGVATVVGSGDGTLVLRPKTADRPIRVGTPQGLPNDTLDISDTDLAAIDDGWKRVVIGDEAVGTGTVTIGSIGTQQGGRNSSLASTTTIVGGSVTVAQKVDVAATAGYLQLVARTGDVTVNAAINETAAERNDWLRLESVQGDVTIKAPIRATQTVSLISGKTTSQTSTASIITSGLRVSSGGAVTLDSQGNAFDTLAVVTTNDAISIRENSGYTIGTVDGVSGVTVGTATATLRSIGTVGQTAAGIVSAAELSLQGAGGTWTLTQGNSIGTLSANTGSLSVADVADLTVGSVTASKASGTAVELQAPSGIKLANAIGTLGGDVVVHDKAMLATDITIDVEDGSATGEVEFRSTVDGTAAGQQSLSVTGKLDARDSIGATTALKSLSVSDAATLAGGKTFRTTGDQTYSGMVSSAGTITVQAGSGAAVKFLGNVSLGGLATVNANYDVELTGTSVTVTNAATFNNTGSVKLGNDATDDLHFAGGLTSSAPSMTSLAGTVRTTNANATFGNASPARGVMLTRDATVSTGAGSVTFAGTVNGARRLVVNAAGDTTFSSVVGGDTPLAHLETDAAGRTLLNGGAITTASPTSQVYNDDVVLGVNTTITANNGGAVTFAKTINGSRALTVNTDGTTTFGGTVGNATPLTSVTTDRRGTTRLGGSVTTSGGSGQDFNDAVILTADATLAAGSGAITFASSLDGAFNLAVNTTGTSTFGGKVGDGTPLASLATDSVIPTGGTSIVTGGLVRTLGQQAWRDNVVSLATDATFHSANGAITAGAATTFSSSGKSASFSAATGIGTAANPIRLAQTEVTATITGTGDIYLVGVGDLVIASAGLLTPAGRISLDASGDIRVPSGGRIAAGSVPGQGVSATKPIRWSVVGTADSGAGSLRQVIANANTTGVAGVVVFSGSRNEFLVGSRLPVIASPLTIDGTNRGVVINANRQVDAGLILQAAATGSVVRGLTLQNFTGFGITLDGVRNATIERNTVTSINTGESMGLRAQGDLAGTKVLGNTFSGGLRGALLDGARNLIFGEIGNGNVLSNNRAALSNPSFAGTGIRAEGVLTGTVVAGNTFTDNNYGFAFIGANNLRLERNLFTRNSVAAIYIEGDSRGSIQTGNEFGKSRSDRNKVNLLRSQGTKFGGAAVTPVGQPQVSVTKNRK